MSYSYILFRKVDDRTPVVYAVYTSSVRAQRAMQQLANGAFTDSCVKSINWVVSMRDMYQSGLMLTLNDDQREWYSVHQFENNEDFAL